MHDWVFNWVFAVAELLLTLMWVYFSNNYIYGKNRKYNSHITTKVA